MKWYKTLTIHQRINLKDVCTLIVGISWVDLTKLFTFKEIIELLHQKLLLEGFKL